MARRPLEREGIYLDGGRRTAEKPIYEATPVHIIAWLAGVGLSVFVYIALAYVCSQLWQVLSQLRSRG